MSNKFLEYTYCNSYPPDGKYLCRLDEDDDEPLCIDVICGQAFKSDGKRRYISGFEWKIFDTYPTQRG